MKFGGVERLCGVLPVRGCCSGSGCFRGSCPDPSSLEESSLRLQLQRPLRSRGQILWSAHWEFSLTLHLGLLLPQCSGANCSRMFVNFMFGFCILVLSMESRQGFAHGCISELHPRSQSAWGLCPSFYSILVTFVTCFFFYTGSHVAQAGCVAKKLALNSFCLSSAGITAMHYHTQPLFTCTYSPGS